MISGNSVFMAIKKETAWGTVDSTDTGKKVKIASESLKPMYNKISEGLATGNKGAGLFATMGSHAEGSFSTLLRPDMGYFLALALGSDEIETGSGTHTITAVGNSGTLPSCQLSVDRGLANKFVYSGCKVNRLSLSAQSGDYLKCDVDVVGKGETTSTTALSTTASALRAFKFAQGKVYIGSSEIADIKSMSMEYNNNLDYQTQTTSTGDHYKEPSPNVREITSNLEVVYSADAETLKTTYYKADTTFALKLEFTSDEEYSSGNPYKLTITIPCNQMSDAGANMGSPTESLSQSMSISAVDNGSDELITIELENGDTAEYI